MGAEEVAARIEKAAPEDSQESKDCRCHRWLKKKKAFIHVFGLPQKRDTCSHRPDNLRQRAGDTETGLSRH